MTHRQHPTPNPNAAHSRFQRASQHGFHWKRWRKQKTAHLQLHLRPHPHPHPAPPPPPAAMPSPAPAFRSDKYRGVIVDRDIDPRDGKTAQCDRSHTFDAFLAPDQMPAHEKTERVGHTWELVRAIKRLRKLKKPLKRMARRRKGKKGDALEHELLIGVKG